ncbi:kinase-like protein [Rhizodiscina lignyota]|uniref:Kinase-like protein n=1 Tax=Rhizodiscina lignyota TaxID=1504668 RepID=A0A9P4M9W3_9PEZI|nr:kinase-like protein [Rhizodiscina lignyota]
MPSISQQTIISVGIFAVVHRLNDTTVRKLPRTDDLENLAGNIQATRNEAYIYTLLGDDPLIANCLSRSKTEDYVDLQYYANGTLPDYIDKNKNNISDKLRAQWSWQVIKAVARIHELGIIHGDLALRQYLLDDSLNARLSDFCGSGYPGQRALAIEGSSHCLPRDFDRPSTTESDLFALGSTLYELWSGETPFCTLNDQEIETRYMQADFADVTGIHCGHIILCCWRREFSSADEVLSQYNKLSLDL